MQKRRLGRTELMVSCIGLGGMGFISPDKLEIDSAIKIIHTAIDRGVNFIDTARSYFDSEQIIGKGIKGRKVYISSKTYMRTAQRAEKELIESCEALGVKKIDLYSAHHVQYWSEFEQLTSPKGAIEAFKSYKKQGIIDFIGVSSHNPEILPEILKSGIFDAVEFPFSPVERGHYSRIKDIAKKNDIGTIIMKPLAGGNIASVEASLKFLLSHDISTIIPGCSSIEHVMTDTEVGINFKPIGEEEKAAIIHETDSLPDQFCRRCRYCEKKCPKEIPISDIFRCEDYIILSATYARDQYKDLKKHASDCIKCGKCEEICPYHLPVREKLIKAHKRLTSGKLEDAAIKIIRKAGLYDIIRALYFKFGGKIPKR